MRVLPDVAARLARRPAASWMQAMALAACLTLPLALLHARALAEILIAVIDVLFLCHSAWAGQAAWLRRPFAWAAGLWWAWLVVCSALGTGGLLLGILAVRLPVLALALGEWLLAGQDERAERQRRILWVVLAASLGWIALQAWQQDLTGHNLFGQPRYGDGALTGPFNKPRAGPAFILLFFPALVPLVAGLASRPGWRPRALGIAVAVLAVLTMVLIGQRMPTVLMLLGLAATALLLPRLRLAVLCASVAGAVLLAALPWASPAAAAKLVAETREQMSHFSQSAYGLIFVRAVTVAELHPWLGQGFDGFRRGCTVVRAMHGVGWLGVPTLNLNGGLEACNLHPHNYYLEALDDAGLPGLALFIGMVAAALVRLGANIGRRAPALQVGSFVGAVVAFWPVASTSALTSMPNGGWVFLVVGLGFAVVRGEARQGLLF